MRPSSGAMSGWTVLCVTSILPTSTTRLLGALLTLSESGSECCIRNILLRKLRFLSLYPSLQLCLFLFGDSCSQGLFILGFVLMHHEKACIAELLSAYYRNDTIYFSHTILPHSLLNFVPRRTS
eukprot:Rmarinus@m.1118